MNQIKFYYVIIVLYATTSAFSQTANSNSNPETWKINYSTVFYADGSPVNESIAKLIDKLTAKEGDGIPLTREEFINIIVDPRAELVYSKELVKYATPKSRHIQKTEHKNFSDVFLKEKRIQAGVVFLGEYESILAEAESLYNVSRKDLVSILMWESGLGEFTGKNQVFNIFMGQILYLEQAQEYAIQQMKLNGEEYPNEFTDTPKKQKERFAALRKSAVNGLTSLLRYSKLQNYHPLEVKGSWGGAIGYTQFMPYRLNVAVDGDKDGDVDLFSWPDAIHSVAYYLRELGNYGWEYEKRKKGIYSYNHSDDYVQGVIAYADSIWIRYKGN